MSEIKDLKSILNERTFIANGKKYIIMDKLAIDRWIVYEKLQPQVTYGVTFNEQFAQILKAWNYLNEQQFGMSAVVLHNLMSTIKNVESDDKRIHPALQMAALFIVREDENVAKYDAQLDIEKIADWQEEGLNMMDFFQLSLGSITGFRETLIKSTQERLIALNEEIEKK